MFLIGVLTAYLQAKTGNPAPVAPSERPTAQPHSVPGS